MAHYRNTRKQGKHVPSRITQNIIDIFHVLLMLTPFSLPLTFLKTQHTSLSQEKPANQFPHPQSTGALCNLWVGILRVNIYERYGSWVTSEITYSLDSLQFYLLYLFLQCLASVPPVKPPLTVKMESDS